MDGGERQRQRRMVGKDKDEWRRDKDEWIKVNGGMAGMKANGGMQTNGIGTVRMRSGSTVGSLEKQVEMSLGKLLAMGRGMTKEAVRMGN